MKDKTYIHLEWDGPFSRNELEKFNDTKDRGIYQVYGKHPLSNLSCLLYIGLTSSQRFGSRILQHGWCLGTSDANRHEYYLGRLIGETTPPEEDWSKMIDMAERLLICAHFPLYNSKIELGALQRELQNVHVLNWKHYRDLFPEVSGDRWTDKFESVKYGAFFDIQPEKNSNQSAQVNPCNPPINPTTT